ncbi:MAG: TIGR04283 family arsenosugar biosynthesis glycosyltransferase [Pseudomonadales bacterium]|nr:TIGR04283 family arsenosugar biosynthesis glycosyltransferase [Pseudomonadales bacterium]
MKKISIIIPVLSEPEALRQHLPALQALRHDGHELIVVDGGSDEDSRQVCASLVDVWQPSAAGRAVQMNAGAALATGDILLFLHIDTLLPEDAMTLLQARFAEQSVLWGRFDVRLSGRRVMFRVIESAMNLRSRLTGVATGDQAIFVRRETFARVGGFPAIPLMEDIALSKLLRKRAWPLCLKARVMTSSRRWERHGVWRTMALMWRLRLLYVLGVSPSTLHAMYMKKPG